MIVASSLGLGGKLFSIFVCTKVGIPELKFFMVSLYFQIFRLSLLKLLSDQDIVDISLEI